jgi:hypothetical protein
MPVPGLPFIALEFHGKGDRMFEGSADDRVLGKRGAFGSPPDSRVAW